MSKNTVPSCELVIRQPTRSEIKRMKAQARRRRREAIMLHVQKTLDLCPPLYDGKILSLRRLPCYIVVREMTGTTYGRAFPITYARSLQGDYIGDVRSAHRLVNKYGISVFEKTCPTHSVVSIGYNLSKRVWFGWSHRAIMEFKRKRDAIRFAQRVS